MKSSIYKQWFPFILLMTFSIPQVISQENLGDGSTLDRPNILFCIADDASYQHMSAYGMTDWVKTPAFDHLAEKGLLFTKAYTPNAKCAPRGRVS